ncbi:MAG: metallophosphoesterase [candidate division FCPU426 bacterium]
MINILHISDLHLREENLSKIKIITKKLFEDLRELKLKRAIKPDIVIFSGDMVWAGDQKKSFQIAKGEFIDPLLRVLNLNSENFFVCPGNHDIQRSLSNKYLREGIEKEITSPESIEDLYEREIEKLDFRLMKNYKEFSSSYGRSRLVTANEFVSTYKLLLGSTKVGIACFNTAWMSGESSQDDHGKLLLGFPAVDKAAESLEESDLRIAVFHHPIDLLHEQDKSRTRNSLNGKFHILLRGHEHELSPTIKRNPAGGSFESGAGALFEDSKFFIGYSIISINNEDRSGRVLLRSYFKNRSIFDDATNFVGVENNPFEFSIGVDRKLSKSMLKVQSDLDSRIREEVKKLNLPTQINSSHNELSIEKLFIHPTLSLYSNEQQKGLDQFENSKSEKIENKNFSIEEILNSEDDVIFLGKQEAGKTWLLRHIQMQASQVYLVKEFRYPVFLTFDIDDLSSKNAIKNHIEKYLLSIGLAKSEARDQIENGAILLLIDDIDFSDKQKLSAIKEFKRINAKTRIIGSSTDGTDVPLSNKVDSSIFSKPIHIQHFGRTEAKRFINKWNPNLSVNEANKLCKRIIEHLDSNNLPSTPMVITWIMASAALEKYVLPKNKALLVERILDLLLEKHKNSHQFGVLDFRNLQHFLQEMAKEMVNRNEYIWTLSEFQEFSYQYFKAIDLDQNNHGFVEHLILRGILISEGDNILFRFQCFAEYFIAKAMIDDQVFFKKIVNRPDYYTFISEFDYFTGLTRDRKWLLNAVSKKIEITFGKSAFKQSFQDVVDSAPNMKIKVEGNRDSIASNLEEEKLDEDKYDEGVDSDVKSEKKQTIVRQEVGEIRVKLFRELQLFSVILRNSELIDDSGLKKKLIIRCLEIWLAGTVHVTLSSKIEFPIQWAKDVAPEKKTEIENFARYYGVPFIFMSIAESYLLSEKSHKSIRNAIKSSQDIYLKMFASILLSDSADNQSIDALFALCKLREANAYIRHFILMKLRFLHFLHFHFPGDEKYLRNKIAELMLMVNGIESNPRVKSDFIEKLKAEEMHRKRS